MVSVSLHFTRQMSFQKVRNLPYLCVLCDLCDLCGLNCGVFKFFP